MIRRVAVTVTASVVLALGLLVPSARTLAGDDDAISKRREDRDRAHAADKTSVAQLDRARRAYLVSIDERRRVIEVAAAKRRRTIQRHYLDLYEEKVRPEAEAYRAALKKEPRGEDAFDGLNRIVQDSAERFRARCRAVEAELGPLERAELATADADRRRALDALEAQRRSYLASYRRERAKLTGQPLPPEAEAGGFGWDRRGAPRAGGPAPAPATGPKLSGETRAKRAPDAPANADLLWTPGPTRVTDLAKQAAAGNKDDPAGADGKPEKRPASWLRPRR